VWLNAIAKTRKNDGCYYYAYVERDKNTGKPKIMRDFGAVRAIVKMEEFYPIVYLDSSYVKKFKKDEEGTEKLIAHLKKEGVSIDFENATRKDLDKENIKVAIQHQLADEKKKSKLIIKD
jgi:disulfide oxidoreductase YuzD